MGIYEYAEEYGYAPNVFLSLAKENVKPLFAVSEPLKKLFLDGRYYTQYREWGKWRKFYGGDKNYNDALVCRLFPGFKLPKCGEDYLRSLPLGTLVEYKEVLIRINSRDGTEDGIFLGISPLGEFIPVPDFDKVYVHNSRIIGRV